MDNQKPNQDERFEQLASQPAKNLVVEFLEFLVDEKKWWLVPIVVVLLALAGIIVLTGTPVGPFIYAFF